ncbi:MAG: DHA2 family efflux MFS transporter permease subunit [Acidimicrobiales bacterium]
MASDHGDGVHAASANEDNRNGAVAPPEAEELDGIDPTVYERRWKILGVLCTSLLIVIIGNTVLNVALPTLQMPVAEGGIGATNTDVQWFVDAYGLIFAGLLFTAAALGDRFGRKGALHGGLVVFALGSLLGAFAGSSIPMVIAGRAVMGVGAAFVMPSTLSILTNVFPARERPQAIAIWAGISGAGGAIGPLASGFLLEHFWWGSVFLVNIPIIAAALAVGAYLVPRSSDTEKTPLDPVGSVLSIVGLGALVYAIIEGPHHGWLSGASLAWFGGAIAALVAWGVWESRIDHPMLDLNLFRHRGFSVAAGGITLIFFAMFGTFFMLTQYLQGVLGYSPLGAAVRLLPISVVMMVVAPQTPKLVQRFGAPQVGATGLATLTLAMIGISRFQVDTSYLQLVVTMMVMAGGMAMTMTPMTTRLMTSVPLNRAGMGSATNDTTRELGGALGVAVLGSLVTSQYSASMESAAAALPGPLREVVTGSLGGVVGLIGRGALPADTPLLAEAKSAFVDGLSLAALVGAAIIAIAAVLVYKLMPPLPTAPIHVESHRPGSEATGETSPTPGGG